MEWIHQFQLFLFDFDGLLVNTEEIHFAAYRQLCASKGFQLTWDFPRYCLAAHHSATGLRDQIYQEFPALQEEYPEWDVLYKEKKRIYLELLAADPAPLMPGVKELLNALREADIPRCVVTHSAHEQVQRIRDKNPLLNTIPHWFTREDYSEPKPSPECYRVAIDRLAPKNARVVGFEDSPRGLAALMGTHALPVLVNVVDYPEARGDRALYFPSMSAINLDNAPVSS